MSFQDRPYNREQNPFEGRKISFGLPRPTQVVKLLLIINIVVYIMQLIWEGQLEAMFAATSFPAARTFQVWRLITFQFLHANTFHLLFNMIGLYFLGPTLERNWNGKRFLYFYLTCGAVGGALYVFISYMGWMHSGTLIGASGGVLGLLVACAILFPQIMVILFIFPVPIRFAAILLTVVYILSILGGESNAGGDICHLGGMAVGFLWVMARPYLAALSQKKQKGAFQKKQQDIQKMQFEIDRILAKVHDQGIQSLSRREKQILQQATKHQQRK